MSILAMLSGLANLLTILIKMFKLFPQIEKYRQAAFLITLGLFFGAIASAISGSDIQVSVKITGLFVVLSAIGFVIIWSLIAITFTSDRVKLGSYHGIAGVGTFVFIIVLFFGALFSDPPSKVNIEKSKISITELNYLADKALVVGDEDRAIMHLETIMGRLSESDERRNQVENKIQLIKKNSIVGSKQ